MTQSTLIVMVLSRSNLPRNFVVEAVTHGYVPEAHESYCRDQKTETPPKKIKIKIITVATLCVCSFLCMCGLLCDFELSLLFGQGAIILVSN